MQATLDHPLPALRSCRKRGAPRKLSEARERRVVLAYWDGRHPVKTIALRFGISRTAVYDMVRRNPDVGPSQSRGAQ